MPKVKDEYFVGKRDFILNCTGEMLKEKPLYLISMRDIIKKAGFSQGVIYRYYANLDEVYVDFINKHTTASSLEQKIDALLNSEQEEIRILEACFIAMGEYIAELLKSVVGETFFELLVLYSSDFKKRTAIFPKLKFKQSLEYAQNKIVEYAMSNMDKGVFRSQIPVHSVIQFVSIFIDGIAQNVVFNAAEGNGRDSESATDIPEMFQTLATAVIGFLEE
ncbi:MAG: TetR/AcrR family transcriptional regulator [Propionibacteriaceae bacterium]|jgi:AcrR family transcriptional regulator|nr:TetR/AcrR family transcriptional regulator [Propionibacteriaceae bacterium]